MCNELISKIIWRTNFLFGCLFCFLNKVGYRSCFAMGVKLEQFLWNCFDVKEILEVIYCRPDCALSPTCFFSNPQWNFMCYYTKVYFNIIPTIHKKTTTITNFILDEIKRSISISVYYGWKRSIKNDRWREIDLKIIFWLQISYSPHSGTNKKIKWDMCLCILNIILVSMTYIVSLHDLKSKYKLWSRYDKGRNWPKK
jgi:hypothetical protein